MTTPQELSRPTEPVSLTILGFGLGWVGVDKPAHLSVHNDPDGKADLLGLLKKRFALDSDLARESGFKEFLSPSHRLDRETSGAIVLATNSTAASELQMAFADRQAKKVYRTVVRGRVQKDSGVWNYALTDRAEGRKNPAGSKAERKEAESRYRVLARAEHSTTLEIELITGRQHQIRRHAALAGHAIIGDLRYGEARHAALIERLYGFSRLLLHSEILEMKTARFEILLNAPVPSEFDTINESPSK